jgi:predicted anti-sigma-YlaC factor YlaD
MLTPVPPIECVQARESASARLDGELPELDDVRLNAHLRGCAECRVFTEDLAALAAELRAAPQERPAIVIFAPRRRRVPAIRLQTAAAALALVAAAAGSSFVLGRAVGSSGSATPPAATAADLVSLHADSTEQHLLAMLGRLAPVPARPGRLQAV